MDFLIRLLILTFRILTAFIVLSTLYVWSETLYSFYHGYSTWFTTLIATVLILSVGTGLALSLIIAVRFLNKHLKDKLYRELHGPN